MKKKRIKYLDYTCVIGERVQWETLLGEKLEGVLKEWDSNVATVEMDDGTVQTIKC